MNVFCLVHLLETSSLTSFLKTSPLFLTLVHRNLVYKHTSTTASYNFFLLFQRNNLNNFICSALPYPSLLYTVSFTGIFVFRWTFIFFSVFLEYRSDTMQSYLYGEIEMFYFFRSLWISDWSIIFLSDLPVSRVEVHCGKGKSFRKISHFFAFRSITQNAKFFWFYRKISL